MPANFLEPYRAGHKGGSLQRVASVRRPEDDELTEEERAFYELLRARGEIPKNDPRQNVLGPKEHGAYAEMRVRKRPIYGLAEQLVAIPGYTAAKYAGLMGGRSRASVDEMAEAYRGVGRALKKNLLEAF